MPKNVGSIDRIIRVLLAMAFGWLVFSGMVTGFLAIVLGLLGVVFLVTAAIGYCPIYHALKMSTRRKAA